MTLQTGLLYGSQGWKALRHRRLFYATCWIWYSPVLIAIEEKMALISGQLFHDCQHRVRDLVFEYSFPPKSPLFPPPQMHQLETSPPLHAC